MRWNEQPRLRRRLGQQRLADAGHVLDKQVPLGQQGDESQTDDLGLAQKDAGDVVLQLRQQAHRVAKRFSGDGGRDGHGLQPPVSGGGVPSTKRNSSPAISRNGAAADDHS